MKHTIFTHCPRMSVYTNVYVYLQYSDDIPNSFIIYKPLQYKIKLQIIKILIKAQIIKI